MKTILAALCLMLAATPALMGAAAPARAQGNETPSSSSTKGSGQVTTGAGTTDETTSGASGPLEGSRGQGGAQSGQVSQGNSIARDCAAISDPQERVQCESIRRGQDRPGQPAEPSR